MQARVAVIAVGLVGISIALAGCRAESGSGGSAIASGDSGAAAVVRAFPVYPGATWDGETTSQEADGQLVWVRSWTAPAGEIELRRFFLRHLAQLKWQVVSHDLHQFSLRYMGVTPLRGYLRFGSPEWGKKGVGMTLGLRDPRQRQPACEAAVPGLPVYPRAAVRECELTRVPGGLSFSLFMASSDEPSAVGEVYSRMLEHSRWHGSTRLLLGPDIAGELATGLMVSIDLPEGALTDLPG